MEKTQKNKSIILFDGYCLLCEWSVKFVLKQDKFNSFLFASLQSEMGMSILREHGIRKNYNESVILVENSKLYHESDAALRITKKLNGLWPILYSFIIIPKCLRNWIYKIVSRNRFKWFKKKNECYLPKKSEKDKFL